MPEQTTLPTTNLVELFDESDGKLARTIRTETKAHRSSRSIPDTFERRSEEPPSDLWWRLFLQGQPVDFERTQKISTVDLFCGPGGLSLGFREAAAALGMSVESLLAADTDEAATDIHASNHRTRTLVTDSVDAMVDATIRGVGDEARWLYEPEVIDDRFERLVGTVDAVLAGPPCQGHSNLNNKTRRTDTRNELYLSVPAIAVALEAPIVIIENVPTVVNDHGSVVAAASRLLLDSGYNVTTHVLSADKMGWPQTRKRFFLVATKGSGLELADVERALLRPTRDLEWAIGDLQDSADSGQRLDAMPTLNEDSIRRIDWLFDNEAYELINSERPECHQDGTTYGSVYGRLRMDRPAQTITTGFMTPGRGRYVHPTRRRTITPHEAARIQGFPDTYSFQPRTQDVPAHMRQMGKWIGDAVPAPLGYAAGLAALMRAGSTVGR